MFNTPLSAEWLRSKLNGHFAKYDNEFLTLPFLIESMDFETWENAEIVTHNYFV